MDMISIPAVNMTPILPEIFLSVLAMALLLINVFRPGGQKSYLALISFFGIAIRRYATDSITVKFFITASHVQ